MFYLPKHILKFSAVLVAALSILFYYKMPEYFSWINIIIGSLSFLLFLLIGFYYFAKSIKLYKTFFNYKWWVNFHIYISFAMFILAIYHSQLKFVSLFSYFFLGATFLVFFSGLLGQYLYIKIPRSRSGLEESRNEIIKVAEDHAIRLMKIAVRDEVLLDFLSKMDEYIQRIIFAGKRNLWSMIVNDFKFHSMKKKFKKEMEQVHQKNPKVKEYQQLIFMRITIESKIANMSLTRKLLKRWNYFHLAASFYYFVLIFFHIYAKLWTTSFDNLIFWSIK